MITIEHRDCLTRNFDNICHDVMIVDPPYSRHVHEAATSCGTPGAKPSNAMQGAAHRDLGFDHLSDELRAQICYLAARANRWSCIFTDTESVGQWQDCLEISGAKYICSIPWIRWSMPRLSGDRPPQGHEMIVLAWGNRKGKKSWNGPGNLTHFAQTCMRGANKHKAQKPLDLILTLVEYFSNPGELVIDPCLGSGTTAVACAALDRNFWGCEKNDFWVAGSKQRLIEPRRDDEERYDRYLVQSEERKAEMIRMAQNTARIRTNRDNRMLKETET